MIVFSVLSTYSYHLNKYNDFFFQFFQKSPHNNRALLHSFSTNDAALGEYKYTVTFGQHSIKITGNNLDLVKVNKIYQTLYFYFGQLTCNFYLKQWFLAVYISNG